MKPFMPSTLQRFAPLMRDPDQQLPRQMAAQAWHELGMIIIWPDDIKSWTDRKYVENVTAQLYGQRSEA